ncbi:M23 family metallopeptidase [Streptomyces sp. TP-A0874]|uniref:M23 family metallopeptidase n=1 Tax=Streptomyces sp. TP-A0874 TaxID=549819 RepID=UPI0008535F59|nr:M23 family metallopeptidase [Streptomyces sp. TP-A0874]
MSVLDHPVVQSAVHQLKRARPGLYGLLLVLVLIDFSPAPLSVPGWARITVVVLVLGTELLPGRARRPLPPEQGGPRPPTEVEPPVSGRWTALNSPADRVPSHGQRGYGQAYAIDVVREPVDGSRPPFGWWPVARRPEDFPSFGAPALAVADGTVVRVRQHRRDHLSRNSYPALPVFFLEAVVRDASGPGGLIGNHVVLDLGDGVYALYAHLRRGSVMVGEGDRVRAGQQIAQVGNSGNSTEPHLHFQLMDRLDLHIARGLPFGWRGLGVPRNGEPFEAPAAGYGRSDDDPAEASAATD